MNGAFIFNGWKLGGSREAISPPEWCIWLVNESLLLFTSIVIA